MSDASVSFSNGLYTIEPITFEVKEDGMIYLGVTASTNTQWVIWDNFQLSYFGKEGPAEPVLGDVNGDREVTTSDAVMIVGVMMEGKYVAAADVNNDGSVDIVDVVADMNIVMEIEPATEQEAGARMDNSTNYLTMNGNNISLTNSTSFVGFQMDVTLAEGAQFNGIQLSERANGLNMRYARVAENTWRVVVFALDRSMISGNEGNLLTFDITGNSTINVTNIKFADAAARGYKLGFQDEATGISLTGMDTSDADIYNMNGVRTNTMRKGMNIIRNANGEVKKVLVK
jgi:hypothetical protein